jgi:hypothetical protein
MDGCRAVSTGGFGAGFEIRWPPKALQDKLYPTKVTPDPEFKPFDLELLKTAEVTSPTESSRRLTVAIR